MEALLNIFQTSHEQGSAEWDAFNIMKNDLRPLTRFFRTAVDKHFTEASADVSDLYYRIDGLGPISREDQLADIQEAYNS